MHTGPSDCTCTRISVLADSQHNLGVTWCVKFVHVQAVPGSSQYEARALAEQDKENLLASEAVAQFLDRVWPRYERSRASAVLHFTSGKLVKSDINLVLASVARPWWAGPCYGCTFCCLQQQALSPSLLSLHLFGLMRPAHHVVQASSGAD